MSQPISRSALPEKRPLSLFVLVALLVALAVVLRPRVLIALGPMRGSLTHPNEMVRHTTTLEVHLLQAMCWGGAAVLLLVALRWEAFRDSRFVAGVLDQPLNPAADRRQRKVNNSSLWIMLGATVLWVLYLKLGTRVFSPHVIANINREDGLVEGGTALWFAVASVAALVLALKVRGAWRKGFALFLAFGFFMCVGEEMSWGQHEFGWKTPEAMKHLNVQAETNLHNMTGYFADHVFIAGTLLYGGLVPFVAAFSRTWRRIFDHIGVVVGSLGLGVGFIVVTLNQPYLLGKWIGHKDAVVTTDEAGHKAYLASLDSGQNPIRIQEGRELLSALGYALLIFEGLRALRRQRVEGAEPAVETESQNRPFATTQST